MLIVYIIGFCYKNYIYNDIGKRMHLPGIIIDIYQIYNIFTEIKPDKIIILTDIEDNVNIDIILEAIKSARIDAHILSFISNIKEQGNYLRFISKQQFLDNLKENLPNYDNVFIYYTGHVENGSILLPTSFENIPNKINNLDNILRSVTMLNNKDITKIPETSRTELGKFISIVPSISTPKDPPKEEERIKLSFSGTVKRTNLGNILEKDNFGFVNNKIVLPVEIDSSDKEQSEQRVVNLLPINLQFNPISTIITQTGDDFSGLKFSSEINKNKDDIFQYIPKLEIVDEKVSPTKSETFSFTFAPTNTTSISGNRLSIPTVKTTTVPTVKDQPPLTKTSSKVNFISKGSDKFDTNDLSDIITSEEFLSLIISKTPPKSEIIIIMDCCMSDGLNLPYILKDGIYRRNVNGNIEHSFHIEKKILLITSTLPNQNSIATKNGSIFTGILCKNISLGKKSLINLINSIKEEAMKMHPQTPTIYVNNPKIKSFPNFLFPNEKFKLEWNLDANGLELIYL